MEHPVVKWTLSPRDGQRQWVHLEANAVLEHLRPDVRVGDRARDSDEDEEEEEEKKKKEEQQRNQEEEEEKEGGDQEDARVIAARAPVAAKLALDVDEPDREVREVPPFLHEENMENLNQDAEETVTGNQSKDEDQQEEEEAGGNEEKGGVIVVRAAVAPELGLDLDETDNKTGEVPPFPPDETIENLNQDAEETETGNEAKDEDDAVDGGKEVVQIVQDPVAPPRSYTCGHCSEGIDLDSTFYICVGHSCRGTFRPQSSVFKIYLFYDFLLRFFYLRTMRVYSQ